MGSSRTRGAAVSMEMRGFYGAYEAAGAGSGFGGMNEGRESGMDRFGVKRFLALAVSMVLAVSCLVAFAVPARAEEAGFQLGVRRASDAIRFDPMRYLNQNTWYQNAGATVWWAGFSGFDRTVGSSDGYLVENNHLVPVEDAHVESVSLTHLRAGERDGVAYAVPEGDGTNAASGTPVRLFDVFPLARPRTQTEAFLGDNAYPTAYDYVECGPEDATHLTARWHTGGHTWLELGLTAKGTHNWDAATGGADTVWTRVSDRIIEGPVPAGDGIEETVTYYRAVMPDEPYEGHDSALLEIVPEFGYYVTDVVVTCCFRGNAYTNCSVYNTGHAFMRNFGVNKGDTVSLVLDSEVFCHGSNGGSQAGMTSRYYIMVRTERISGQLFVEYDAGEVAGADDLSREIDFGRDGDWLTVDVRGNSATRHLTRTSDLVGGPEHVWQPGDLDYTVDAVRPDVLSSLSDDGWEFAGWDLQYYAQAEESGGEVTFDGEAWNGFEVEPEDDVRLKMHAKLTALWERINDGVAAGGKIISHAGPGELQITKAVADYTMDSDAWIKGDGTYEIYIKAEDAAGNGIDLTSGAKGEGMTGIGYDAGTGWMTAVLSDTGYVVLDVHDESIVAVSVREKEYGDALGPYYDVVYVGDGSGTDTFVMDLSERTDPLFAIVYNHVIPRTRFHFIKTASSGAGLAGASFTLESESGSVLDRAVSAGSETVGAQTGRVGFDNVWLPEGLYYVHEIAAPDGYNMLNVRYPVRVSAEWMSVSGGYRLRAEANMYDPGDEAFARPIMTIVNSTGFELPSSGGPGVYLFYASGLICVTMAACLFACGHKRRRS